SKDSYDSNLDKPDLLVTYFSDANKDECFDSRGNDDEINVLDCEDSYYDSEGDIIYLESFLNDDLVHRDPSIPAMSESDEFIKPSVEDLVLIPSESEDTSVSESVCILPSFNDFCPIDIPEEKSVTFSNPLFNSNDDFIPCNDELLSNEDVPEDNVKIYSNPFFEFNDEYISSEVFSVNR
nr:hypothetical protein [Tanacetum cinerariifolium]